MQRRGVLWLLMQCVNRRGDVGSGVGIVACQQLLRGVLVERGAVVGIVRRLEAGDAHRAELLDTDERSGERQRENERLRTPTAQPAPLRRSLAHREQEQPQRRAERQEG